MSQKNMNNESGRFDFVGGLKLFGGISLLLTVVSLIYLAVNGLNYGIDFRGGTEIQVRFAQQVEIDRLRAELEQLGLGEVGVQAFGENNEYVIRFQGRAGATDKETNEILNASIAKVKDAMEKTFGASGPEVRRVDTVGPQVGAELKKSGFLAVFYCLLVILIYVGLRFDYQYSPGAVVCLFHDAVVTLAIFVAMGKEVNVPVLAAIMTLIGFSLNDTIVVFDRIRETEGLYRGRGWPFIINRAINDMLVRTFITAGAVFLTSMCLWIFAGGTVSDIGFILAVGIFFGVYSSVYVAAQTIILVDKLKVIKPAT